MKLERMRLRFELQAWLSVSVSKADRKEWQIRKEALLFSVQIGVATASNNPL